MAWRPTSDTRWMDVDDVTMILVPSNACFVELDRSGSELWAVLVGASWDSSAVVAHLVDEHDLPIDVATAAVDAFLQDLSERGVLDRCT